jgi:hypothetical protein
MNVSKTLTSSRLPNTHGVKAMPKATGMHVLKTIANGSNLINIIIKIKIFL